jgi:hypothetical protein
MAAGDKASVQWFGCTRSVFTSITSKMIFRCTKIISFEEILVFPIKLMYLFSRSTTIPYILSAVHFIFFSSIKVVQEYD